MTAARPSTRRNSAQFSQGLVDGTDLEIRAGFDREDGASTSGLIAEFFYFVLFALRILKQSLSLSCSLAGL